MKENTTKTETTADELLMQDLDEILAMADEEYKVKATKRQLEIVMKYGGSEKVLVGQAIRKHLDIAGKRLLLDIEENIMTKSKNGTQVHKGAFIQVATAGEVAELRRAINKYSDLIVVDKATMEVITVIDEAD